MGKEVTLKDLLIVLLRYFRTIALFSVIAGVFFAIWGVVVSDSSTRVQKGLLFFIVGILVGAFLSYIVCAVISFHCKTIQNSSDIRRRYNIPVLAEFLVGGDRKSTFADRWIRKLEQNEQAADSDLQRKIAAESLKLLSKQHAFLLTGSASAQAIEAELSCLTLTYEGDKYYHECVLESPETIEALCSVDGVVLIEKSNQSTYQRLNRQIFQLDALGKEIYGLILL